MPRKQKNKTHERVVTIWKNPAQLNEAAAHFFMEHCLQMIAVKGHFSVALSGGNTPKGLYNLLASSPFAENIPWRKVFFFWSDERFVPHTHPDSNFRMAKENMLDKIPVPAKNIFSVKGMGDPAARAAEYEHVVKTFFHSSKPVFDLIILGIGEDGHTASIFPGTDIIHEKKKLIREVWVEEKKSWRISFTIPLINQAEAVLFLVSGTEKKQIVKKIFRKKRKLDLPVELVNLHDGIMYWMMDEDAAQKKPGVSASPSL